MTPEDIKKFVCTFIGCGKTTAVLELAARNIVKGETCCVVTNFVSPTIQRQLPGVDFIPMKDIISELHHMPLDKSGPQYIPMLSKYDRVMIDPACYEQLIYRLLTQLGEKE